MGPMIQESRLPPNRDLPAGGAAFFVTAEHRVCSPGFSRNWGERPPKGGTTNGRLPGRPQVIQITEQVRPPVLTFLGDSTMSYFRWIAVTAGILAGLGLLCLLRRAAGADVQKVRLSDKFYAEGAYYGDFNRDGKLDVVAGPFWYEGPDFQKRHEISPGQGVRSQGLLRTTSSPTRAISTATAGPTSCASAFPARRPTGMRTRPARKGQWKQHLALKDVGNESPMWVDVNGDGRPELIYNTTGYLGYATYDPAKPDEPWVFHPITPKGRAIQRFTHGIGTGDINGDGRIDMVEASGWWEQPAEPKPGEPWILHPFQFADAGAQMFVYDVDGDGLADVITAWHCHQYGLVWYKQVRDAKGEIDWQQHVILPPKPDLKSDALRISQMHGMDLVDINGDGLKDIVTGKRFWAHGPHGDAEPNAPAVLYWFELRRDKEKGVHVHPAPDRRRFRRGHAGDGRRSQRRRHPRRDRQQQEGNVRAPEPAAGKGEMNGSRAADTGGGRKGRVWSPDL